MGDSALKLRTSNLPRRILHVIATVHPNAGGPSTVVTRLAAAQAALGHEVTILSFLPSKSMGVFEECAANIPGFDRVQLILKPFAKSTRWLMRGASAGAEADVGVRGGGASSRGVGAGVVAGGADGGMRRGFRMWFGHAECWIRGVCVSVR